MKLKIISLLLFVPMLVFASNLVQAQVKAVKVANQRSLLQSTDPQLAKNKKLVYDFWREVLDAGHLELTEKYMNEGYIQHNPNVPTGRQGFIETLKKFGSRKEICDTIKSELFAIVAEGNFVTFYFNRYLPEPHDSTKIYHTTWFDMLRIENGKLAEHWDGATK